MSEQHWNPWKMTTIGLVLMIATALVTGLVVAGWHRTDTPSRSPAILSSETTERPSPAAEPVAATATPRPDPARAAPRKVASAPPAADVRACNAHAKTRTADTAVQVARDAAIAGAVGAGVGAATGAIADGGKGAGKGAGIGGVVGLAAGTLYGLNASRSNDARYVEAYRACMKARGHTG